MKKKRFIAFLIDIVIISIITCLLSFILVSTMSIPNTSMIVGIFICILIICKDCWNGASIGKLLMNIQVVNAKDSLPASPLKCAIRNYMYFIWVIELFIFFCMGGNRLGDYLTRTKVSEKIKDEGKTSLLSIFITISIVTIFFTLIYLYMNHIVLNKLPS